jgi:hypothetical protein
MVGPTDSRHAARCCHALGRKLRGLPKSRTNDREDRLPTKPTKFPFEGKKSEAEASFLEFLLKYFLPSSLRLHIPAFCVVTESFERFFDVSRSILKSVVTIQIPFANGSCQIDHVLVEVYSDC